MKTLLRLAHLVTVLCASLLGAHGAQANTADLIVRNARITTLNAAIPEATALAVKDGKFVAVGDDGAVAEWKGNATNEIDAGGRRLIPGLNDSHLHATRGARFYNLELRWDGVKSLKRGLEMIAEQSKRTPKGEWVRVIGGWSPYQFEERRMPTVQELNEASPDTPVFVLCLYSRGFLNAAGAKTLNITAETKAPPGGRYEIVDGGAVLYADPDPGLLYQTIAKLPGLSAENQVNSARQFFHELNRLGITSAVDAGGGGHQFPDDYAASNLLAQEGGLSVRISYYLFPQKAGEELASFQKWMGATKLYEQLDKTLEGGYQLEGGGEYLTWSTGDLENFMAPRPDFAQRGDWKEQLTAVTTELVRGGWPLRIHATYRESLSHILDVFEQVAKQQGKFAPRWVIDHAETATEAELKRIKALGGGVAIQDRMAFAGEYFAERYGKDAGRNSPPVRAMLEMGLPVGAGTDGTRVASYNPWLSLYWLVTGKTMGGASLFSEQNKLSRAEALELWTHGSAWISQEEKVKGRIAPGQYADFAILNADYMNVPEEQIKSIAAVLTVTNGKPVFGAGDFVQFDKPMPAVKPDWSPVVNFGGYQ